MPDSLPNLPPAEQLRQAELRLAAHVDNTPLAVTEWDHESRLTRWNEQAERLFGWSAAEVLGLHSSEVPFIPDENRALTARMTADAASGRQPRSVVTVANLTKSGGVVWCEWYSSVLYDANGRMVSALSLALDVTARRAAAEALELSEARTHAALDGAKMLAWDLDLLANKWRTTVDIPDFYGIPAGPDYTNPELALHAVHPDDVPAVLAGRARAVETGAPMRYEFRGRAPGAPRARTAGRAGSAPAGRCSATPPARRCGSSP
jgi:PAS domain S-box-containing protein